MDPAIATSQVCVLSSATTLAADLALPTKVTRPRTDSRIRAILAGLATTTTFPQFHADGLCPYSLAPDGRHPVLAGRDSETLRVRRAMP